VFIIIHVLLKTAVVVCYLVEFEGSSVGVGTCFIDRVTDAPLLLVDTTKWQNYVDTNVAAEDITVPSISKGKKQSLLSTNMHLPIHAIIYLLEC